MQTPDSAVSSLTLPIVRPETLVEANSSDVTPATDDVRHPQTSADDATTAADEQSSEPHGNAAGMDNVGASAEHEEREVAVIAPSVTKKPRKGTPVKIDTSGLAANHNKSTLPPENSPTAINLTSSNNTSGDEKEVLVLEGGEVEILNVGGHRWIPKIKLEIAQHQFLSSRASSAQEDRSLTSSRKRRHSESDVISPLL